MVSISALAAAARRSIVDSANEQEKASKEAEDGAFTASIAKSREANALDAEKAEVDYYKGHFEAIAKLGGPVGEGAAGVLTMGDDELKYAGPAGAMYTGIRQSMRADYDRAEGEGGKPAYDNPIARGIVFADDKRGMDAAAAAADAKTDVKVLDKAANEARTDRQDAAESRKQTLSDARSLLEDVRALSREIHKRA
jgi:hypothetical protein